MTLLLAAFDPPYWQSTVIKVLVIGIVVPTTALILGIVFLFKVMAGCRAASAPRRPAPAACSSCSPTA